MVEDTNMQLLLDIGNTRIKWGLADHTRQLVEHGVTDQDMRRFRELMDDLVGRGEIKSVTVCCVGEEAVYHEVTDILRERTGLEAVRFASQKRAGAVRNSYTDVDQLGADRWAAMIAAWELYGGRVLVCNCGTAVTLDIVKRKGRHKGGYIMPGLGMARRALSVGTANLPEVEGGGLKPADNTAGAIAAGTLLEITSAIERVHKENRKCPVVLTGGDAEIVGQALSIPFHHEPALVLKGLAMSGSGD